MPRSMSEIAAKAVATPQNSAAFWREGFEPVCFDSFILKQALKQTRSVCLRAF